MPNERDEEIKFPLAGVEVSGEFGTQRPGTTPRGLNVRVCDAIAFRLRGGSRHGTTKLLSDRISGANMLQHLNVIVDPTTEALLPDYPLGATTTSDPSTNNGSTRNPGRTIPQGGSLVQPTRQLRPPETTTLALEESGYTGFASSAAERTHTLTGIPASGELVLAIVGTNDNATGTTVTVTDGAGNAFTQVGNYVRNEGLAGIEDTLSLWRRTSAGAADDQSIKVLPSAGVSGMVIGHMVWSGQNATPLGTSVENFEDYGAPTDPMDTTNFTIPTTGDAAIGIFFATLSPDSVTPNAGYTLEINKDSGVADASDTQLYVTYKLNCTAGNEQATALFAGGADAYSAIGVAIKD